MLLTSKKLLQSAIFLSYTLMLLSLSIPAEGGLLNLSVRDVNGNPAAGIVFQIFPGSINVDDDTMYLKLGNPASDRRDNDGDGEIDEGGEDFPGYATDADGMLQLDLDDGLYTLVGFSKTLHYLFVREVSVPGSAIIRAANAVPVSIECLAADGSPMNAAEVFFRPTKLSRASVGSTDSNGILKAYVSSGDYHVVLWSAWGTGPHYLVLPNYTITPPEKQVDFRVAQIPTGEVYLDVPVGTAITIFEVLKSTYTNELSEGVEPEVGYDAAYTDFYPQITTGYPFTLSANIDYNFNMSYAVLFESGVIYAYELRPALHSIKTGVQRAGITEDAIFSMHILADGEAENLTYVAGDKVNLSYSFTDDDGNLLNRILNYTGARLVFPIVVVWDPNGVPIANNFDTVDFFKFSFDLPLSAVPGEYKAEVNMDAGMYGKIGDEFRFQVLPYSDLEPPQINPLEYPSEFEAGQDLIITAVIRDNVGISGNPELLFSMDAGASWTDIQMKTTGGDLYSAVIPWELLALGELNWQITAQDLAGNSAQQSGSTIITDTSPPVIQHETLATAEFGRNLQIQADVKDNVEVREVVLVYIATVADAGSIEMSGRGETYSASIPAPEITFDGIKYYIQATDTLGNVAFLPDRSGVPEFASVNVRDTTAPVISHNPVSVVIANSPVRIEAIITDNSGVVEATLYYKSAQEQDYLFVSMESRGNFHSAEIPAEAVIQGDLQYHITAIDGADPEGNTRSSASPADGGDHSIEVRAGPYSDLARLVISPWANRDTPLDVAAGESVRFTAIGLGEANEQLPVGVTWTATGGIGYIDQDGLFLAAGRIFGDGIGSIVATARHTGVDDKIVQAEAWVRLSPMPPALIALNPGSITIAAGSRQEFFATVTDVYSNPVDAEINWSMDASEQIGTMDAGIFSASKAGSGFIIAEADGIQAIANMTVIPEMLREIVISSPPESAIAAGAAVQFTADGYDAFGNHISIAPVWSVRGGIGSIRGDGLFRGGTAGTGWVAAIIGEIEATVDLEVVPGELHHVSVSPFIAYLAASTRDYSSTHQFVADGWDIAGNPVPLKSISWTVDGFAGTISSSGLFTAAINFLEIYIGEIVLNDTIRANARSFTGKRVAGIGYVVILRTPASLLSSVNVIVQGISTDLGVIYLATGESAQFEAAGSDMLGKNLSIDASWSVEGGIGDIDVNGLFTATRPGSGAVIATAGGFTGRVNVEVTLGSLKSISIRPDMLVLTPGSQHSLTAIGYDSFENVVPLHSIRWSIEGNAVTIEQAGVSCVVTAIQPGNSIISASAGDLIGSANIFVSAASVSLDGDDPNIAQTDPGDYPYYLEIEPELISIAIGAQQQFTAQAVNVMGDEFDSGSLSWSVAGGIGEVDGTGVFRAGSEPGSGRVIVTDGQTFGTAVVTISASDAQAQELFIIPSQVSLVAGAMQKFAALIRDADGELIPTLPAWRVIGSVGVVDAAGRFVATAIGAGEVEAIAGGLSARCQVTVSPGSVVRVEIQPDSLSIRAGGQQRFSVISRDEAGNLVNEPPAFQLIGDLGAIDDRGLFTAQNTGAGSVMAFIAGHQNVGVNLVFTQNPVFTQADIEVLPGDLSQVVIVPVDQSVLAGSSVRFAAIGKDAHGNVIPVDPAWDIDGNASIGSISSNGLFIADRVGQAQVRARAGGIIITTSIEVLPAAPVFILVEPPLLSVSSQSANARQFSFTFLDLRGNIAAEVGSVELTWEVSEGVGFIDPQTGLFVNETDLEEPRTGYVTVMAVIDRGSNQERTIRGRAAIVLHPVAVPLTNITVTPNPAMVIMGDTQKFSAAGRDADGTEMEIYPVWSVVSYDSGSEVLNAISADGTFTATSEMRIGSRWRVLASSPNIEGQIIQGEAELNLIAGPLQSIEVMCTDGSCTAPIESGQTVEIAAVGYDQFRNQVDISPDWRVTGEIGAVSSVATSRDRAVLIAGRAGSGEVIAEAEGKEGKIHIIVTPGPLVGITVSTDPAPSDENIGIDEANPLIIPAGSQVHFVAHGSDSDVDILGNSKPVNPVDISPIWSMELSDDAVDLGSISSDGIFTGREAGTGWIEAKADSIISSFYIQVIAGDLVSIRVSPSSVSVVAEEGKTQKFSASGYDLHGNQIANLQPTWQITGDIGDVDANGVFTPISLPSGSSAVSGTVIASVGGIQGSSSVIVVSALGKLSTLSVTIEPSVIPAGSRAICIIRGTDERGNPIADFTDLAELSVSAPENLGTVTPSDDPNEWTFRADRNLSPQPDERSGLLTVTAKTDDGILSDSVSFTLVPGPLSSITIEPAEIMLSAGEESRFKASGYDSWGNQRELSSLEWTIFPQLGQVEQDANFPQEAVFTATTAGQGQLIASSQGYDGYAAIEVLPGKLETLTIEPESITIPAGESHRFVATGKDQYGNGIEELNLQWQIIGDASIGSLTGDGTFSAAKIGEVKLKAVYDGVDGKVSSNEASVIVVPGAIASAEIFIRKNEQTLEPPFVLLSGVQYDLHVRGSDLLGNQISIVDKTSWGVSGDIGAVESSSEDASAATLTTLFPGRGQIFVTIEDVSAHAEVEVVPHSQTVNSRLGARILGPFESSLNIPPNALRIGEEISIAIAISPGTAGRAQRIGHVYNFKPDGLVFQIPAELTLSYASVVISEIDDEKLSIYSWDKFQKKWLRVGGIVDESQKSVTATVNYLTLFAIMQSDSDVDAEIVSEELSIADIRLAPNTYFAPEINRLAIHYRIRYTHRQPVDVTMNIYDIKGHLVRELMYKSLKYPGWNTDQWDGTNETGEVVKNGRYILLITAETDSDKVSKTKHIAVFK